MEMSQHTTPSVSLWTSFEALFSVLLVDCRNGMHEVHLGVHVL